MKLLPALRLALKSRLALVGAGGKTTTLFRLAREYLESGVRTVFVCTTTHLAIEEVMLADRHYFISDPVDLQPLQGELPAGIVALTGPLVGDNRVQGVGEHLWNAVHAIADEHDIPLLIEADGSRRKPLKAPAMYEPVIPSWVDDVVVVAGLSGLQQPLTAEWVHRPEIFAELSGLPMGQAVTSNALGRVLAHPAGGLRGIPERARRAVLLNQADTPLLQASGQRLAEQLAEVYTSVLVASVRNPEPVWAVYEKVAAIVLAAGAAQRLGQPKQLLLWNGETLAHRVARMGLAAGLDQVIVVTGAYAEQVAASLTDLAGDGHDTPRRVLQIVHNPDFQAGQSTSIVAGLRALHPDTGAVVFLLADQPGVTPSVIRSLVETHARSLAPIVAPLVDDRRANPVLFDRRTFDDLLRLQGDTGGRALFARYPITWLPWLDANLLYDIDTPEDYRRWLASQGAEYLA